MFAPCFRCLPSLFDGDEAPPLVEFIYYGELFLMKESLRLGEATRGSPTPQASDDCYYYYFCFLITSIIII